MSANGSVTLQVFWKNGSPRRTYILTSLLMEEMRANQLILKDYCTASGMFHASFLRCLGQLFRVRPA
jgi:hypothetical protein